MKFVFVEEGEFVNYQVLDEDGKVRQAGSGPSVEDCLSSARLRWPDLQLPRAKKKAKPAD